MSFVVTLRDADARLADDQQIVLRLGTDADVDQTIKASLGHFLAYRPVVVASGLDAPGALTLSVYLRNPGRPVVAYRAGPFQRWYRTTTVGHVIDAGVTIWPTDVSVEGEPLPLSSDHADLVVSARSDVLPDAYLAATKSERRRMRDNLRPEFEAVLALFDAPIAFGLPDGAQA
ncbi:MAG TPA: hypothetical protein VNQ73_18315 [Ilumatobacter sp.]|nr:hypothetical protein [Ilumatobacter sp.]